MYVGRVWTGGVLALAFAGAISIAAQEALLFSEDGNYLVALDAATGATLWHAKIGAADNAPETYMLDGQQYLLATGDSQLFAFVLNQARASEKRPSASAGN